MPLAFILRFEEQCHAPSNGAGATGTETVTKVAQEQSDADPAALTHRLIPLTQTSDGTGTSTRIRNEQGDADYCSPVKAIPAHPIMGTSTATAVKMEADDKDPRQQGFAVLPR
jgi:hypothetical protein